MRQAFILFLCGGVSVVVLAQQPAATPKKDPFADFGHTGLDHQPPPVGVPPPIPRPQAATPQRVAPIVPTTFGEPPQAKTMTAYDALTTYKWNRKNEEKNGYNGEIIYFPDGTCRNIGKAGTDQSAHHWTATGPKTFTESHPKWSGTFMFNDDFTRFERINSDPSQAAIVGTRGPALSSNDIARPSGVAQRSRPQPTAPVSTQPPNISPPAPVAAPEPALAPHSEQPMIEVLSDQAPNVANWITAPLDREVPPEIWQNMTFLKEALRDEAAKHPVASQAAYGEAVRLCYTMVAYLENRRQAETLSGGDAVLHQKSNLTEWRRDHLTWPMYFLERDERAERQEKAKNTKVFLGDLKIQEWANKSHDMRTVVDAQYEQFREALRQSPAQQPNR